MDLFARLFGSPVTSLKTMELQEKIKGANRPFILDVRQPEEFREGHIAGAGLIPLGQLKNNLSELPKQREIVCVCESGSRSRSAARMLASEGYQVFDLQGGMSAWQQEKLPIKKGTAS
jgi:rhodanese-related sulfurtransferase